MSDIEEIRCIATEVRRVMEDLVANGEISPTHLPYVNFPNGCCGVMSYILIQHFRNLGYGDADYMSGLDCLISGHTWIRLNGICIDITADQFNNRHIEARSFTFGSYPSVIVEDEKNYPLTEIFPLLRPPSTRTDFESLDQAKVYDLIKQRLKLKI